MNGTLAEIAGDFWRGVVGSKELLAEAWDRRVRTPPGRPQGSPPFIHTAPALTLTPVPLAGLLGSHSKGRRGDEGR